MLVQPIIFPTYYTQPFQKLGNLEMITAQGIRRNSRHQCFSMGLGYPLISYPTASYGSAFGLIDVALTDEALIFRKEGAEPVEVVLTKEAVDYHLETFLASNGTMTIPSSQNIQDQVR